jgi:hypothetical protein
MLQIQRTRSATKRPSRSRPSSPERSIARPWWSLTMVSKRDPDPLHRPAERLRRVHQRDVLGIGLRADAEAAADVARVEPDALGRHAGDGDEVRQHHREPCELAKTS